MDFELGATAEDYVLAIFELIDATLARTSTETLTVLLDTRAREGAANVPGIQMVPFGQQVSRCLSDNCPERLSRIVVYPVPFALSFIWGLVRPFLAPKTADKIRLLSGPALLDSPCPAELGEFVGLEAMREEDRDRHAALADQC